jgi:hypothetical protein
MSMANMERRLLEALQGDTRLKALNCEAHRQEGSGLVVSRRGHLLGIWRWERGAFAFTPGGYTLPTVRHRTIEDALAHTRAFVAALP